MTKKAFDKIKAGLDEALAIAGGRANPKSYVVHVPAEIHVRSLRVRLGLSQAEFATAYGFNVARVRDWEQGRSRPDGAVRAYLTVIDRETEAVDRALHSGEQDAA